MARRVIGSRGLGIDLASGQPRELFKWFLACLLFGRPIQQQVARRAYLEFVAARLLTPRAILRAGWDRLVEVLDRGHYVRFDFSTATKLMDVCSALAARYGNLDHLLEASTSRADVARRLQAFKGVGPTTTRIFLRDVAALWPGARYEAGRSRRGRRRDTLVHLPDSGAGHGARCSGTVLAQAPYELRGRGRKFSGRRGRVVPVSGSRGQ